MSDQYIRKVGLFVTGASGSGEDLSNLEIIFRVEAADSETPNTAHIRVYNLSESTVKQVKQEFQRVRLQAGYEGGNYGVIFEGQIMQFRTGRESAKDSFLDMLCSDGDQAFQFAYVNKSLAAGASAEDKIKAVSEATSKYDVQYDAVGSATPTGGVLPRGKVLFGLAKDQMGPITSTLDSTWFVQNGKIVVVPMTGYLSGEAVVLNARTGLIGTPEATPNGIELTCLLNPKIRIGTRVQLNNALINQTQINQQGFPRYTDLNFVAGTSTDGFYRVLVVEHHGDVRGADWTTSLTCLAVNQSSSQDTSVLPYGTPDTGQ